MNFSLGRGQRHEREGHHPICLRINLIQFIILARVSMWGLIQWGRQQNRLKLHVLQRVSALECLAQGEVGLLGEFWGSHWQNLQESFEILQGTRKARPGRAIFDGWHGIGDMLTCWQPNRMWVPAKDARMAGWQDARTPGRPQDEACLWCRALTSHRNSNRTMGQLGRTQWERAFSLAANNDRGFQGCDWKLFALRVNWKGGTGPSFYWTLPRIADNLAKQICLWTQSYQSRKRRSRRQISSNHKLWSMAPKNMFHFVHFHSEHRC